MERSLEKCPVWGCPESTQAVCSQAQELGSQVWGCSQEFPLAQESSPKAQGQAGHLAESQELAHLGDSSLESLWGIPLRPPNCQEATVFLTAPANCPMAMGLEEQSVLRGPRLGTRQEQGLAHRQHWQRKQQSMVLEEREFFLVELAPSPA